MGGVMTSRLTLRAARVWLEYALSRFERQRKRVEQIRRSPWFDSLPETEHDRAMRKLIRAANGNWSTMTGLRTPPPSGSCKPRSDTPAPSVSMSL